MRYFNNYKIVSRLACWVEKPVWSVTDWAGPLLTINVYGLQAAACETATSPVFSLYFKVYKILQMYDNIIIPKYHLNMILGWNIYKHYCNQYKKQSISQKIQSTSKLYMDLNIKITVKIILKQQNIINFTLETWNQPGTWKACHWSSTQDPSRNLDQFTPT